MNKNITVQSGNCNHRKYIPTLLDIVESGIVDTSRFLTNRESFASVIDAYIRRKKTGMDKSGIGIEGAERLPEDLAA